MGDVATDNNTLELVLQLARIYSDEGFRTRVENDELKLEGNEGEMLLQFQPDELKEAAVTAFQLYRWLVDRAAKARVRQNRVNSLVFGEGATEKFAALQNGVEIPTDGPSAGIDLLLLSGHA